MTTKHHKNPPKPTLFRPFRAVKEISATGSGNFRCHPGPFAGTRSRAGEHHPPPQRCTRPQPGQNARRLQGQCKSRREGALCALPEHPDGCAALSALPSRRVQQIGTLSARLTTLESLRAAGVRGHLHHDCAPAHGFLHPAPSCDAQAPTQRKTALRPAESRRAPENSCW